MVGFDIFNPQTIDKYTTVTVSDGYHSFRLLLAYIGNFKGDPIPGTQTPSNIPAFVLYWPDYSAEAFGDNIEYRVTIHQWNSSRKIIIVDTLIDPVDSIACAPFRFEANDYNQVQPINWEIDDEKQFFEPTPNKNWYYVSVRPWIINDGVDISAHTGLYAEDNKTLYLDAIGRPNREYVGSQNAFNLLNDFNISLNLGLSKPTEHTDYSSAIPNIFDSKLKICFYRDGEEMSLNDLKNEVKNMYLTRLGDNTIDIKATASLYIADDEHIYAKTAESAVMDIDANGRLSCNAPKGDPWRRVIYKTEYDPELQETRRWLEETNEDVLPEWYDSMRIFGWVKFYHLDEDGEPVDLIGYKTNMVPVTQDMWAFWSGDKELIYGDFKMSNFPRTINKTIQQVTNITATTDSKAGIVQPVFIRVRDAASLVIHPAVTENICINLDAYKSSVKKFMIQIEGCTFAESGRTAGGVVFKVVGNKLSGQLTLGTYYILNEDSEVVTSGRYQYEY